MFDYVSDTVSSGAMQATYFLAHIHGARNARAKPNAVLLGSEAALDTQVTRRVHDWHAARY